MSSLIQLKLPFLDRECLENAIKEMNLEITEMGENIQISNGILLKKSKIGYTTSINYSQERFVNKLHSKYEQQLEKKKQKLEEQNRILTSLNQKRKNIMGDLHKIQESQKKKEMQEILEQINKDRQAESQELERLKKENEILNQIKLQAQEALAEKIMETVSEFNHISTKQKIDNRIRISVKLN